MLNSNYSENSSEIPAKLCPEMNYGDMILSRLHESKSMKNITHEGELSQGTIARVIDCTSYGRNNLPSTISIDEFKEQEGFRYIASKKSRLLMLLFFKV